MAGSKGERAIKREQKRAEKEKRRRIEAANKMLIPVPKATRESLGLISFDPNGTFRMEKNRWIKVFQITQNEDDLLMQTLIPKLSDVTAKVRITKEIAGGIFMQNENQTMLTLTTNGETYDEVRTIFSKDEEALKGQIGLNPLGVDEVMRIVLGANGGGEFSYASMVRGKKDWKKECFPKITASSGCYSLKDSYGESLFCLQYPDALSADCIGRLKEIGCPVAVSMELAAVGPTENLDFNRAIEQKYNRRIAGDGLVGTYANASFGIVFTCDSQDAREIIEKTILAIFSKEGFLIAPSVGMQSEVTESMISLGLREWQVMRNVPCAVLEQIKM